jgi:aryl-alcohol dehydrogenase-like predicted oxidoreductase
MSSSPAAPAAERRRIGPFDVRPIGLGCMNLSHAYGAPPPADNAERLLLAALDAGVELFDTAALYGFGGNERLVGRVLAAARDRVVLCSKGGMTGQPVPGAGEGASLQRVIDGRPASIRRDCEDSLRRLGTDRIDLYYLHRWDKAVPIEESVGAMADLVRAGKVRALGLSEVSAATLRRAHAEHPIAALQTELSPWTRNPEIAVLEACRQLGVAFVAFSPVARGVFTDTLPEPAAFDARDIRRAMPRFAPEHWPANLRLREGFVALAREAGCTAAQLSLAWVLARGEHVLAIPGTTQLAHLHENLATPAVPKALLEAVGALMTPAAVSGSRYAEQSNREVDTETFETAAGAP